VILDADTEFDDSFGSRFGRNRHFDDGYQGPCCLDCRHALAPSVKFHGHDLISS